MRFVALQALLALSIGVASAFKDTSPFIFFSTSEILASSPQIATAASLTKTITAELEKCPSDIYVVVSQPGVNAVDFSGRRSDTHLIQKWISGENKDVRSSFSVSDVVGEIDPFGLTRTLEQKCSAGTMTVDASTGLFDMVDDMRPRIIRVDFPSLPAGQSRSSAYRINDLFLANLLNMIPSSNYTVLYTTTPISAGHQSIVHEPTTYHMDDTVSPLVHMDLKRDLYIQARAENGSTMDTRPLFEKYQFFTPAIFMGLVAASVLLSILYVAISGVAGLQVSYAAFDREMGPAAQKKN